MPNAIVVGRGFIAPNSCHRVDGALKPRPTAARIAITNNLGYVILNKRK